MSAHTAQESESRFANILSIIEQSIGVLVLLTTSKFILYLRLGDLDWMGGAMSGTVYNSSQELGTLMTEVHWKVLVFLLSCLFVWRRARSVG